MNYSKLLHQALENTNWDYIVRSFRGIGVQWYGSEKLPTKKELIADLTEIIQATFEKLDSELTSTQTVTPHWIVCVEEEEDTKVLMLEVIFTPFALFIDSKGVNKTQTINLEKFKERLTIALDKENYEIAALVQEALNNYKAKN